MLLNEEDQSENHENIMINSDINSNYANEENFSDEDPTNQMSQNDFIYDNERTNYSGQNIIKIPHNNLDFLIKKPSKKAETVELRNYIVSTALILISLGILLNLTFTLSVLCRKKQHRKQSATLLVLTSMCLSYFLFLIFYSVKISIYFYDDNITKFHMYDTFENWTYGEAMCRVVSALPTCCKLISRLGILLIVLKRLLTTLFLNGGKKKTEPQNEETNQNLIKKVNLIFQFPFILIVSITIWVLSVLASLPVFFSYKLNKPELSSTISQQSVCFSIYSFPEEIHKVNQMHFNYLLFATTIPTLLILTLLLVLTILQSTSLTNRKASANSLTISMNSSSSSLSKKNTIKTNSSLSSTNTFDSFKTSQSTNNLFLWSMILIHAGTTLPQEVYKMAQLYTNFADVDILENYFQTGFEKILQRAWVYYLMQLWYASEFVLMPALFLLFFVCSKTHGQIVNRSESDLAKSTFLKRLSTCFHDRDLKVEEGLIEEKNAASDSFEKVRLNTARIDALLDKTEQKFPIPPHDNILNHTQFFNNQNNQNDTPYFNEFYDQPTNESENNVLHIIQHPSWRINIKQQQQQQQTPTHLNLNENTFQNQNHHLPFTYVRTNIFNDS